MRALAPLVIVALAGCPGDDGNASVLWLSPDMVETRVKLAEEEPDPW